MGEGRVLDLLRCLWKMNHGGLHRERSRGETHLVREKKQKQRIEKRAETILLGQLKVVCRDILCEIVTISCSFTNRLIMKDNENRRKYKKAESLTHE